MDENKRVHDRFTLWLPIRLDARSGRMVAVCRDASAGGVLVSGSADLNVGDPVTISLRPSPGEDELFIIGRIVRVEAEVAADGSRRMAIEFLQPVPQLEGLFRRASSRPPPA